MKYKISLCISALCFFTAFLILMASRTTGEEALASRIAPEILRFHVLAESDSARDQNLKLGVKGLVLDYIRSQVPEDTDKEQLEQWIERSKTSIEAMAQDWLADQGASYPVKLELTRDYFPTKAYGDMVFPCGTYDAVRITIGSGKGRNWWCVLYPSLCYTDAIHAVVPDSSRKPCHPSWRKMTMTPCYPPGQDKTAAAKAGGSRTVPVHGFISKKGLSFYFFWLSSMS